MPKLNTRIIISLLVLFIGIFALFFSSALYAQQIDLSDAPNLNQSQVSMLMELADNPKLYRPQETLENFIHGQETAPVIVNLRKPLFANALNNLSDFGIRTSLAQAVQETQGRVIPQFDPAEMRLTNVFTYIFGFSAEVTIRGLQALIDSAEIVSIEPDSILHAQLAQGIPLMNATTPRNSYNGTGLSIAICDTGIDYTHSKLGGGGFPNSKVIGGYDCGDNDSNPMDAQGHGTACAGITAGALGTVGDYIGGVAYNAKLYAVKISTGSTGSATTANMIEGWEWCITHQNDDSNNPIMIISTSFGGGRFTSLCDNDTTAMTTAAANAVAAGITLFASSGNDGYCDSIGWPACISHVISVGAVYDAAFGTYTPCVSSSSCATKYPTGGCNTGYYSSDSTSADMVTSYSNTYSPLNLLAPSNWATTTKLGGSYWNTAYGFGGTSAACPYAAGAAAVLQSAAKSITGSYLTPAQVKSKLVDTGNLITDGKVSITKPRVNLAAAVNTLTGGTTALQYSWNMSANPGWTIQGLWAWGIPTGGGGDPASGYTGSNVYGYNLSGVYENNLPEKHLTSTAINCAGLSNVSLKFRRWLGVERPLYDHAYVRISNNGTTWTTFWENSATVTETSWALQDFDISSVADGQSTVYLRWTMGTTDSSVQYCGWNIDDVEIWGVGVSSPCPDCPANGVITNATYPAGKTCSCSNATSITLGSNVTVEDGATVAFTAPTVTVGSGFHARNGASVTMRQP